LAGVDAKFGITAGDLMFENLSLYPAFERDHGTIRAALVEYRRQSRSQFRSA